MTISLARLQQADDLQCIAYMENQPVTMADLRRQIAGLLETLQGSSGQNWVLAADSAFNFLCGFLALIIAGREILLPPNNLTGTINETLRGVDAVLTDLPLQTNFPCVDLKTSKPTAHGFSFDADINGLYIQICTSGSTGEPKQVRKSLQTLFAEVQSLEKLWGISMQGRTVISTVSHQHIYGLLFRVLWPLLAQRPFVDENVEYPEQITALAQRHGELALISSPAYLKRMVDVLPRQAMRYVSNIFSSGGPLEAPTSLKYALRFGVTPIEVLGSTETGGIAYRQQSEEREVAWQCFSDVKLRRKEPEGTLEVKSPFCYSADWFEMGDAVEMRSEQEFVLLGRVDRIVKLEEKRISLDRMESMLIHSGLVEQVRILPLEGQRVILAAVCILSPTGQRILDEQGRRGLSERLRGALSHYFDRVSLPRKWRYVADFPYNAQGKITLADLAALFQEPAGE